MNDSFGDADWIANFRMSKQTLLFIVQKLSRVLLKEHTKYRRPLPTDQVGSEIQRQILLFR